MSNGRRPVQKRSRERVEKILLAAADELAKVSRVEDLTTTSVSHRAGVPVSTLYRYFTDRSEIIAALIDREVLLLDAQVRDRFDAQSEHSMETLLRTIMIGHLEYFRNSRRAVLGWFGARQSKAVLERVNHRYKYIGQWVVDGSVKAGFVDREVPAWGGEALLWLGDRAFEFVFREERPVTEQDEIIEQTIQMFLSRFHAFSSKDELVVVDAQTFSETFGAYDPPLWHDGD